MIASAVTATSSPPELRSSCGGAGSNGCRILLTEEEIGYYREAWSQPGSLDGGLAWYRAMGRHFNDLNSFDSVVRRPTRVIHGEPDPAFDKVTIEASRSWCPGLEIFYLPDTGHFVPQDAPEEVSRLILEFLFDADTADRRSRGAHMATDDSRTAGT